MIRIYVKKQSSYPVSVSKIKPRLRDFLERQGIVSDSIIYISLVGAKKAKEISKRYLKENVTHNVLSFTENEVKDKFFYPSDGFNRLGEIVICYPKALEEAKEEGKLIDEKIYELAEHGARHLLGLHHE